MAMSTGLVIGLASDARHAFSKQPRECITLVPGIGVAGDAHAGETVKHRSRVRIDPAQRNLRQIHLIHAELFDELATAGFIVRPSELGENVTTRGVDVLNLPTGAVLAIGDSRIRVTGLRNPCAQIEAFQPALLDQMVEKLADGGVRRKCGVMGVIERGGTIAVGMPVAVEMPKGEHRPLAPV